MCTKQTTRGTLYTAKRPDRKAKLHYWRGVTGVFAWKAAPALEFGMVIADRVWPEIVSAGLHTC